MELSSESNLFFHYIHQMSTGTFKELQEGQKLMVEFADYPAVLLRMLNHCIKEPHSYLAVFVMHRNGEARLDFIQNMEYKFVELLSCRFVATPEEVVRQQITYRYNSVKSRLALMQARLADVNALVSKAPSVLLFAFPSLLFVSLTSPCPPPPLAPSLLPSDSPFPIPLLISSPAFPTPCSPPLCLSVSAFVCLWL